MMESVLKRVSSASGAWREGVLMVRYDAAIFTSFAGEQ